MRLRKIKRQEFTNIPGFSKEDLLDHIKLRISRTGGHIPIGILLSANETGLVDHQIFQATTPPYAYMVGIDDNNISIDLTNRGLMMTIMSTEEDANEWNFRWWLKLSKPRKKKDAPPRLDTVAMFIIQDKDLKLLETIKNNTSEFIL